MRLIDADALADALFDQRRNYPQWVADTIGNMPDAVVRCKDCKNADYGTDEDGNRFMKCIGSVKCYGGTTPDFFCADGEMK